MRTHHVTYDSSKIIRLWLFGKSASEISLETGASLSTVYRWIRRYGAGGLFTSHVPIESFLSSLARQHKSRAQAFYLSGNPCAICLFAGRQSKQRFFLQTRRHYRTVQSLGIASDWWTKYYS